MILIIINDNNDKKRLLYTLTLLKELGFEEAASVDPAGTQHHIPTSKVRYWTVNSKTEKKSRQRKKKVAEYALSILTADDPSVCCGQSAILSSPFAQRTMGRRGCILLTFCTEDNGTWWWGSAFAQRTMDHLCFLTEDQFRRVQVSRKGSARNPSHPFLFV